MTFFEAAVQVLRGAGRPLHFKKITEQAIQRDLLSHVGKSPEDTMETRLSQEAAKSPDESVIEEVRPGVFGIREGADLDDAMETIRLRGDGDDTPEPEPVTDDSELDDSDMVVDAPSVVRTHDEGRHQGRRRSRRASGNGAPRSASSHDDSDDHEHDDEDDDTDETPDTQDLGDIAQAVFEILQSGPRNGLSSAKVTSALAKKNIGNLGDLGSSTLRWLLEAANKTRARQGRPPVFAELRPGQWGLATASGTALAQSYASLERWQNRHRTALRNVIIQELGKLKTAELGSLVTLLLDNLGYSAITEHKGSTATLSARSPSKLNPTTLAIRIATSGDATGPNEIAALRGSLHQVGASAGVIFAIGRTVGDYEAELSVPNVAPITLVGTEEMADLMITSGVGVDRFSVDVSLLDDTLFRELGKG